MGIKRFFSPPDVIQTAAAEQATSAKSIKRSYNALPRFHMGIDRWDIENKLRNHRFDIQLFHSNRNKSNRGEE